MERIVYDIFTYDQYLGAVYTIKQQNDFIKAIRAANATAN